METFKHLVNDVNNAVNARFNNVPRLCSNPGDALRSTRIIEKWYDTAEMGSDDLRKAALEKFRAHLRKESPTADTLSRIASSYCTNKGSERQRELGRVLLKTRSILRAWLADYKPLLSADRRYVGPRMNAAYLGHLTELDKLVEAERWPCQPSAAPLLRKIAIRNPVMRRRCKQRGLELVRQLQNRMFINDVPTLLFRQYTGDDLFRIGFEALTKRHDPSERDTITTVPKNNKTDRVIAMCTIGDQVAESAVAFGVEECLEKAGCFLRDSKGFDGQYWHGRHIVDKRNATIDFSAASDSNYWEVCKFLLSGSSLLNDLEKVRVRSVVIEDDIVPVPMLATMGRRICFVTMTMILAALCCAVTGRLRIDRKDPLSPQVYGDDVIIQNIHAPLFIEASGLVGYRVNVSKTFVNSPFRESCGEFYHDDFGYLTSFDFKPAEDIETAIALTNKALINFMESNDDCAKAFWYDLWQACFKVLEEFKGPLPIRWGEELGSWCFDPDYSEAKGSNKQTEWLADCLQATKLTVITSVTQEPDSFEFSFGKLMYARFIAYRDGVLPCGMTSTSYSLQRIVVDCNGLRYGTLASLRAQRAEHIRLEKRYTLVRYSRALGADPHTANYLANFGSSELWHVRNFVLSS